MFKYLILSDDEVNPSERALGENAAEVVALQLKISKPAVRFIAEHEGGVITLKARVVGYSPPGGREIFIRAGLAPASLVSAVVHEVRHVWQWVNPPMRPRTEEIHERDAELFVHEFWGDRTRSGGFATMTKTLNEMKSGLLKREIDRCKAACRTRQLPGGKEYATLSGAVSHTLTKITDAERRI